MRSPGVGLLPSRYSTSASSCLSLSLPLKLGITPLPKPRHRVGLGVGDRLKDVLLGALARLALSGGRGQLVEARPDVPGGAGLRQLVAAGAAGGREDLLARWWPLPDRPARAHRCPRPSCRWRRPRRRPRRGRPCPVTRFLGMTLFRRTFAIWPWTTPSTVFRFIPACEGGPESGVERGTVVPAVPARLRVWQEPHFCTNCALPFERSVSSRPQATMESATSVTTTAARRGLTVFRTGLTGREHYPLRGPETVARRAGPGPPRSRPRATLSQP